MKAIEYYEKAVELKDTVAMYNLGQIYRIHSGKEPNLLLAKEYYKMAINYGELYASVPLATVYLEEKIIQKQRNVMNWE